MPIIYKKTQALWKRRDKLKRKENERLIARICPGATYVMKDGSIRSDSMFLTWEEIAFIKGIFYVKARSTLIRDKIKALASLRETYKAATEELDWRPNQLIPEDYYS